MAYLIHSASRWGPKAMELIHMSYPPGFCTPGLSVRQCKPNELAEEASAEPGAALLFQLSPESGEGEEEGWNLPLRAWAGGALEETWTPQLGLVGVRTSS